MLIKRTKSSLIKFHFFLDFLFLTLIAIDLTNIATQLFSSNNPKTALAKTTFIKCDTCTKPNIYFIVFDGYAGNYELQNTLGFDNSAFENELQNKGFHIIKNSISNYNSTPFSLASILNMEYLQGISRNHENRNDIITCYEKINKSKIGYFFDSAGYQIKNLSIFNFNDFETKANEFILFPTKAGLITNQTFLSRLKKDLGYHIITAFHLKSEMSRMAYSVLKDNNATYDQLMKEVQRPSDKPTFIYAHFMMPHYPYYYSADGKLRPIDSLGFAGLKPRLYIGYLQYCNKKISSMIDQILAHSKRKPIIFLIGDHGFREFNKSIDPKYFFYNLSSVYLPNQSYSIFYNGMSNVNLFRSLLNTQFNQNLPMLKDSTVLIK